MPRKATPRDTLTGSPLDSAAPTIYTRDERDGRAIPLRLHSHAPGDDGAPAMTTAFVAFIGECIPVGIQKEWADWREWYANDYVMQRLAERFGEDTVAAVVAHVTAGRARHSAKASLKRKARIMTRAVRARGGYLSNDDKPKTGRRQHDFDGNFITVSYA